MNKSIVKKMLVIAASIMLLQALLAVTIVYAHDATATHAVEQKRSFDSNTWQRNEFNQGLVLSVDLTTLDHDQDGLLSLREASPNSYLLVNFADMDTNSDGYLSQRELSLSDASKA